MNLAAKLKWSIPHGIFLCQAKKNRKPMISNGNMQITNKTIIARIFHMILVFSFRRLFVNEDANPFQKGLCLFKALNMSEYRTVMIIKGMTIKITDITIKLIFTTRGVPYRNK